MQLYKPTHSIYLKDLPVPAEMAVEIFSYLVSKELAKLREVSKSYQDFIDKLIINPDKNISLSKVFADFKAEYDVYKGHLGIVKNSLAKLFLVKLNAKINSYFISNTKEIFQSLINEDRGWVLKKLFLKYFEYYSQKSGCKKSSLIFESLLELMADAIVQRKLASLHALIESFDVIEGTLGVKQKRSLLINNVPALCYIVDHEYDELVCPLLKWGVQIGNALSLAIKKDKPELVALIVKFTGRSLLWPVYICIRSGLWSPYIDNEGEKPDSSLVCAIYYPHSTAPLEYLINKGHDINKQDQQGSTAIHFAIKLMRKEVIEILLNEGADLTLCSEKYGTPLECAQNLADQYVQLKKEIIAMLTDKLSEAKQTEEEQNSQPGFSRQF